MVITCEREVQERAETAVAKTEDRIAFLDQMIHSGRGGIKTVLAKYNLLFYAEKMRLEFGMPVGNVFARRLACGWY